MAGPRTLAARLAVLVRHAGLDAATRARTFRRPGLAGAVLLGALASACAPLRGFPSDPTAAMAAADQTLITRYYTTSSGDVRRQLRNQIVSGRVAMYDSAYSDFKRRLSLDSNAVNLGSDLAALVLAGVAATSGNLGTSTALAAAATGVIGARGAFNSDLYFQRTLPALLAQMDANRAQAKLPVVRGITQPDDVYPLASALIDLDALRDAGGVPVAIGGLTQEAERQKTMAEAELRTVRGVPNTASATFLRDFVRAPGLTASERRQRRAQVEAIAERLGFPHPDAFSILNDNTPEGLARIDAIAVELQGRPSR